MIVNKRGTALTMEEPGNVLIIKKIKEITMIKFLKRIISFFNPNRKDAKVTVSGVSSKK